MLIGKGNVFYLCVNVWFLFSLQNWAPFIDVFFFVSWPIFWDARSTCWRVPTPLRRAESCSCATTVPGPISLSTGIAVLPVSLRFRSVAVGGASYLSRMMVILGVPGPAFVAWINNFVWFFHRKRGISRDWLTEFFREHWNKRYRFLCRSDFFLQLEVRMVVWCILRVTVMSARAPWSWRPVSWRSPTTWRFPLKSCWQPIRYDLKVLLTPVGNFIEWEGADLPVRYPPHLQCVWGISMRSAIHIVGVGSEGVWE